VFLKIMSRSHFDLRRGATMKYVKQMMAGCLALAATVAIGQVTSTPRQGRPKTAPQDQAAASDRGQQVFHQNCFRCHNAPEGFSPSISGSIARHMRVRAGLSDADYKALLKFLNP
jgi:mono/diheme cytochrome c family protein